MDRKEKIVLVQSFLERTAARVPEKTALVCGTRRLGYGELERQANRLAHALQSLGVRRGDRVAIQLGNTVECVVAIFAVLKAAGVLVMVNPTAKAQKLAYLLDDCRAAVAVVPARRLPTLREMLAEREHLRAVVTAGRGPSSPTQLDHGVPRLACPTVSSALLDEPAVAPSGVPDDQSSGPALRYGPGTPKHGFGEGSEQAWPVACPMDDLVARHAEGTTAPPIASIDPDLAALLYTSGSTGTPKGVMLTHLNMVSAARSIISYLKNRPEDVILNVLPLSFGYGLYQVLMAARFGGTVVLEPSLAYPHAVLSRLVEERATGLPLVPTMAALLLAMDLGKYDLSSLRYITSAGAALPVEHLEGLRRAAAQAKIYVMYGLTECARVTYLPPDQLDRRPTSVGRGMPNQEVAVVDGNGRRVAPGETGELLVRGSHVMRGYWEMPEATRQALRPGPFDDPQPVLWTGDLFRVDEEGYLYFVARKDDIIKSRGEKVSPKEVEDALYRHPGVAEAAVLGVPDAVLGEAIHAFVVLRPGHELSHQELLRHAAEQLEDFMVPRYIEFRDALPKSDNGKILKHELQETLVSHGT